MQNEELEKLLIIAARSDWTTQGALLKAEDQFIKRKEIIHLDDPEEEPMSEMMQRYVSLGSLPFVIHNNSYSYHTHRDDYLAILNQLWPDEWLDTTLDQNTLDETYNGRLPTLPRGNLQPKYMIIGDSPGIGLSPGTYDRTLTYGPSSHMLRKALLRSNMYYECWFTNLVKVSQFENRQTTHKYLKAWQPYLMKEINLLKPEHFILLGGHVQDMFTRYYLDDLINIYGQIFKVSNIYHPSYCTRSGKKYEWYAEHIQGNI